MTLIPAYGRDYKSARLARNDFANGKDWCIADISSADDGRYVTRAELRTSGVRSVTLRYDKLRKVVVVRIEENAE